MSLGQHSSPRWDRVRQVFEDLVELDEQRRRHLLGRMEQEEATVRAEVVALLEQDAASDSWLTSALSFDHPEITDALSGHRPSRDTPNVAVGSKLGPYRLVEVLGEGGSSTVFRAERDDQEYRQEVAVKLLRGGCLGPFGVERVRRERQILASLDHPNLARLVDGGSVAGTPYLVMELVEGLPITDYCEARQLGVSARVDLFLQVLEGVEYAHRHLIVHRDLKPANILVRGDGQPKLLDFGIAKLLAPESVGLEESTYEPTRVGALLMTPEYASPEQVRGLPVTTASDIYSLGVLLYHLLTGHPPYEIERGDLESMLRVVCEHEPALPSRRARRRRSRLAGDLDHIVMKALAKDPANRYSSAEALADDLRRHRDGLPVRARSASLGYRVGRFVRRHRWTVAATAIVLSLLTAAGLHTLVQYRNTQQALEQVATEAHRANAVNEFLLHLLTSVNPRNGKVAEVTMLEVVERAEPELAAFFEDEPRVEATLRWVLGTAYRALGRLDDAERHLATALVLVPPGSDRLMEARIRHELGRGLLQANELERAEAMLLPAVTSAEGSIDLSVGWQAIGAATQMSAIYVQRDDLDEATRWMDAALAGADALGASAPGDRPSLVDAAAFLAAAKGDFHESLALSQQAIALLDEEFGPENYRSALARLRLASSSYQLGDYGLSEASARQAATSFVDLIGEEHRLVARAYQAVGISLTVTGNSAEAIDWYEKALSVQERVLPGGHPEIAYLLSSLGRAQLDTERVDDAAGTLERAQAMVEADLPDHHPISHAVLSALAEVRASQGRAVEAEAIHRQVLVSRMERGGPEHLLVAYSRRDLGLFLLGQGRPEEAEALLAAAFATLDPQVRPADRTRLRVIEGLSRARLQLGNAESAIATALPVLETTPEALAQQGALCLDLHRTLASALDRLGRGQEAKVWRAESGSCQIRG